MCVDKRDSTEAQRNSQWLSAAEGELGNTLISHQCRAVPSLVGEVKGDSRRSSGQRQGQQVVWRDHVTWIRDHMTVTWAMNEP